jgi:hypothetical protein
MKNNYFFLLGFLLCFQINNAQTIPANVIPKANGTGGFVNSLIQDNGTTVGIGSANPGYGKLNIFSNTLGSNPFLSFGVLDGTYNPRTIISHVSSGGSQYVDFNSTYSSNTGYAKWVFSNGNVGIGITTPISKLDIYSDTDLGIRFSGIRTHRPGAFGQFAFMDYNYQGDISYFGSSYTGGAGAYGKIAFRQYTQNNVFRDAMYIDNSGNVGIGTTSPVAKFTLKAEAENSNGGFKLLGFKYPSDYSYWSEQQFAMMYNGLFRNVISSNGVSYFNGGNVGIGTTAPDAKLAVKGRIHAEEVVVDLKVPADYVFEKYYTGQSQLKSDYVLPTLEEVAQYTKVNHHLPNVPSAADIKTNGLNVGEMTNVLLQKIEELTLYVIQQQKEIDALKKRK